MATGLSGLSVYRLCLRSVQQSFKGDHFMLQSSRKELRSKFEANRLVSDTTAVKKLLAEGEEAASFIKTFVVQAKLNERGNFEMKVEPHHANATAEEAAIRR
ncbi:hypothetical protein ABBQ32_000835 [Trebouxia sp. C0010 RCD-2024]